MTIAQGGQWSQAASFKAYALYALGRMGEADQTVEEAWQLADRINDPVGGAVAAMIGGGSRARVYDYTKAESWYRRELERPRSRIAGSLRYELIDLLASALVSLGRLAEARELLGEYEGATANHVLLNYCEGNWERAILLLRDAFDGSRARGQIFYATNAASILCRLARAGNLREETVIYLEEALTGSRRSPDLNRELFGRIEFAVFSADLGQIAQAKEHLARCQRILANGEDWGGHRATFASASALTCAAEYLQTVKPARCLWGIPQHRGRALSIPDQIAEQFNSAIEIFRRYHVEHEEGAVLAYWSRVLFAASRHREAAEKFNAAFAIFERSLTPRWCERMYGEMYRFLLFEDGLQPASPIEIRAANVFRQEGDYWTIAFAGSIFRLRDRIGMYYVSRLLANPGKDFAAQELVEIAHKANRQHARKGFRVAKSNGRKTDQRYDGDEDLARERARLMVTKRIKDVIARIRQSNPDLARHLATHIRTGYGCRYEPDEAHPEGWMT